MRTEQRGRWARVLLTATLATGMTGCGDSAGDTDTDGLAEETTDSETTAGETTAGETSDSDAEILELYDCVEPNLAASPLMGPGYNPEMGLLDPVADSYVAHTTQIYVREDDPSAAEFDEHVNTIVEELMQSEGLIAYSLGGDPTCGFARTLGVWRDEESMLAFAFSDAHVAAMVVASSLALTDRVTHWDITADDLPDLWTQALEQIEGIQPNVH